MGLQSVEGEVYEFDYGVEKIVYRESGKWEEGIGGGRGRRICVGDGILFWYALCTWLYLGIQ